jgi:S-adenosylmethionine hydrolase
MPASHLLSRLGFAVLVLFMIASSSAVSQGATVPPTIGLFTDFGWDDPYVAQMKGAIVTISPGARILDLTHSVSPFNVAEGAYLLDQSAEEFPAGTIFVAVVDPQVGTERDPVLIETAKGKFYLGPDNGLMTDVIDREGFSGAWKLDKPEFFRTGSGSHTFHGRDIFGPVAAHLAEGVDPEKVGTPLPEKSLTLLPVKEPSFTGGTISAQVLHVDHYGNIIVNLHDGTDISAHLKEGNLVKISFGRESFSGPLVKTYADIGKGRLLLLYGGSGLLEIGVNQGSAAKMLKVEPGTVIFLKP